MRRRVPWWILALLFIVVPVVELYLIAQLGFAIGWWWTTLILIADGVIGSWLVKHQGRRAWAALQAALESGRMPAKELADGALILIGGTLLMTPGFISDFAGLFCLLPFTRPLARRVLTRIMTRHLVAVSATHAGVNGFSASWGSSSPGPGGGQASPDLSRPDVVCGEVVDDGQP